MAMVEASSQRLLIDKAFSVPKCVRLARMSHHSHQFLRKMLGAVPGDSREDLSEIWGEEFWSSKKENTSKAMNSAQGMEKSDVMEFETLKLWWKLWENAR